MAMAGIDRLGKLVRPAEWDVNVMIMRQAFKLMRAVRDMCRHEVHYAFLAALYLSFDHHQP